jgi:glycosyltransferase involved in cell wall biosynthesis
MAKQIIITKLFEFGGSNSHLKTLIQYFGNENVVLVLEEKSQLQYVKNIDSGQTLKVKVKPGLHKYAHLIYPSTFSNIKELILVIGTVLRIWSLQLKYGFADVTICAVEPEKYLYLFWLPFGKVTYILHTAPKKKYTPFTSFTCNSRIGKRKKIITVSNSNKELICQNWDIAPEKRPFIYVVYNCIIESESNVPAAVKTGQQYIITLGHVIHYKNPSLWLEVAKMVTSVRDDVHFLWLGEGPLWNDFVSATRETERITFPGPVTDPHNYLRSAIIYYQPSLFETHGIAVVEAMYNCLPCVVSDTGGLPESVQQQYNGFVVDRADKNEHAAALLSLIDHPELRKQYGINAYQKYQELFSFKVFKSKMDAVYFNKAC